MTNNSTGMYTNRMQIACMKLASTGRWPSEYFFPFRNTQPGSLRVFNELVGEHVWQTDSYGNYPRGENEERTQLGSDEWRTEWKHHGSKSIHCYQSQNLNPNEKRHFSKERDNLPQGLAKLTTDKKRVSVQAWQVPGYPEYWKQQIRWGHVCDEFNLSAFLSSSFYKRSPQWENLRPVKRWWSDNR